MSKDIKTPPTLAAKLCQVMAAVHNLEKRGRNEFHRYNYVMSTDVYECTRLLLAERNVFLAQKRVGSEWATVNTKKDGVAFIARVTWEFEFHDGDSGEVLTVPWESEAMDSQDKALNKAATAARKYFLITQFQMPVEVPDADSGPQKRPRPAGPNPDLARAQKTESNGVHLQLVAAAKKVEEWTKDVPPGEPGNLWDAMLNRFMGWGLLEDGNAPAGLLNIPADVAAEALRRYREVGA